MALPLDHVTAAAVAASVFGLGLFLGRDPVLLERLAIALAIAIGGHLVQRRGGGRLNGAELALARGHGQALHRSWRLEARRSGYGRRRRGHVNWSANGFIG